MVIVQHKYACGETVEYVIPGASHAKYLAEYPKHMASCATCKAKQGTKEPEKSLVNRQLVASLAQIGGK